MRPGDTLRSWSEVSTSRVRSRRGPRGGRDGHWRSKRAGWYTLLHAQGRHRVIAGPMHAIDFLRDPSKIAVKPVYAVYGDDVFLRQETLTAITHEVLRGDEDDLGIVRFVGDDATLADVLHEVRTLPFFSKRKVVLVDSADPFVTAHRKELEGYVEHPSTAGGLILGVKTWPSNTKLAKQGDKGGL